MGQDAGNWMLEREGLENSIGTDGKDVIMLWKKSDVERGKSFESVDGLAMVVRRLIQEVEVLKSLMKENGIWNEERYRKVIMERFLSDHNSAGIGTGPSHSDYYYTFEEEGFLKDRFGLSDEEIKAFRAEVEYVSSLT